VVNATNALHELGLFGAIACAIAAGVFGVLALVFTVDRR
jgi:hypothetical protein